MKTIDFSYFIERYNAGEMSEAERTWFEKELAGNADLREETELRKRADLMLANRAEIQLRSKLAAIESSRTITEHPRHPGKHPAMRYAAIFAGIILIASLIIINQKPLSVDGIFEKFYTRYEINVSARSMQAGINTDYARAAEYFNVHDYRNAALYFRKVIENDPGNIESTMLYGVSNFEDRNYPEAEKSFHKVREDNNNLYLEDAEWYLALCYLKTNEMEKAVAWFTSIRESRSIYKRSAARILRSIR